MSGYFTRCMYDPCAEQENTRRKTAHSEFTFDINKYVNSSNSCDHVNGNYGLARLIDVESGLIGLDRVHSHCNGGKYPGTSQKGCNVGDNTTNNYKSPYILERGDTKQSVVSSNIPKPTSTGIPRINNNICSRPNN